jgi:hypothetical protein
MTPLTAVLLAERARLGARALPSLAAAASRRGELAGGARADNDARLRARDRAGARGAATEAREGPPRRGAPTSEDEESKGTVKWDSYGALPASPGGQPAPPSREALHEYDVERAEAHPSLEDAASTERLNTGVRTKAMQNVLRCVAHTSDALAHVAWLAQVHVHKGSALPGGAEGVEVTNALPGRPRGAGAPFDQRRGP